MNLSIRKKMWMGFGTVNFLLLFISIIAFFSINDITNKYKMMNEDNVEKINLVNEIEYVQKEVEAYILEYITFGQQQLIDKMNASIERGTNAREQLVATITNAEALNIMESLESATQEYNNAANEVIKVKDSGGYYEGSLELMRLNNATATTNLNQIVDYVEQNVSQTQSDLDGYQAFSNMLVLIISVVTILLGLIIATVISRNISNPIKKVTNGLEKVASGNLSIDTIKVKNKDEVGKMAETFNNMLADLKGIVLSVRNSSSQLAASAEQLSASSEESLASSQMVATSVDHQLKTSNHQVNLMDTSVLSLKDLNSGLNQIAKNNEEMLLSSNEVNDLVTKGASVVSEVAIQMNTIHETFNETTEKMKEMEKLSYDIQNVTALITEVSEQTNLLALNAAIEAARAGEYGKGFAVVADEVRKLAQQSRRSAEEITKMLNHIQDATGAAVHTISNGGMKVNKGLTKTNESLEVFHAIEESVQDVAIKVKSVSTAIEEIHAMADSVTESVVQVQTLAKDAAVLSTDSSAATEQQLAVTQEITSSAQSLANLAESLQREVSKFNI
ncbi:methyl-accepting chemotaxis protein [Ureibacillus massiliensis]|uniref:methyl-accepting chemotaxis protein n=1 Tax=Ureibacillus massiliensis TaxID=292806 RepID=UPI000A06B841|nr:methyl-accepting chemotaxis protein [Ureibacillus massiliensis]